MNLELGLAIEEELGRQIFKMERRELRDRSNPFEVPEGLFRKLYRMPKILALDFINEVTPHLEEPIRKTCVPNYLKVLCALNFYAHGSYQKNIGQDFLLALSQTMVSRCIKQVSQVITQHLSQRYIRFPRTPQEKLLIAQGFMEKYNFPGVTGSIDCTHIAITAPSNNNHVHPGFAYLNRKGYYSINCQIICDSNLKILHCNARYPGSMHDSAIWNMSNVLNHMQDAYNDNERGFWLLGDSGYPLQPWLLTPIENAAEGTPEGRYTRAHITCRNPIERCNGVLKMRFRCLLKHRVLHYDPISAAHIIYACCVLHNILTTHRIDEDGGDIGADEEINNPNPDEDEVPSLAAFFLMCNIGLAHLLKECDEGSFSFSDSISLLIFSKPNSSTSAPCTVIQDNIAMSFSSIGVNFLLSKSPPPVLCCSLRYSLAFFFVWHFQSINV